MCACGDPLAAIAETPGNIGSLRFTLEAEGGSYAETLTFGEALPGPDGTAILWFPEPPGGSRYRLRFKRASGAPGYYLFVNLPLPDRSAGGEGAP